MTQQQNVLSWLKDAHAMEQGAVLTLENHAAAAHSYPEMQSKLHEHAEATRQHTILVERCIGRLGGQPSVLKETIGTVMGKVQGVASLPAQDAVVKNALADLAVEYFEIASYTSLIAAAEQAGDEETAIVCRRILHDEEEMAGWLRTQIPIITRKFLAEQTGEESQGAQAQVISKAKQTLEQLKGKSKELLTSRAKQLAKELEEQGEDLASKAKQRGKDALVVSGALLVGAGVGLIILNALRSGSGEKQRAQDRNDDVADSKDAYNDVRAGYDAVDVGEGMEGLSVEPLTTLDPQIESLDLGEPSLQDAELFTGLETQPEDRLGDISGQMDETLLISDLNREQQGVDDFLSAEADVIGTEPTGGDVQSVDEVLTSDSDLIDAELTGGDVQDIDELPSLDADLVDARLMDNYAAGVDESSSLDANTTDTELLSDEVQDMDELVSLDADPVDAELLADDAQSDVQGAGTVAYTEVWLVPGPYSGLGPSGYDSAGDPVGQEVYSRLTQHGQIDASNIEIVIDNGEVLLEGTVDSEETKRLAEEAVATVTGVSSVQNLLQVQGGQDR